MEFILDSILAGKVSLASAAKQAQRIKCRLRYRNYVMDVISLLRKGDMTWGGKVINFEWLLEKEVLGHNLENQYYSFFKRNTPDARYQKEIDEKIRQCWEQFISHGIPLLPSDDNQQGGGWLKKGYPGEGTGNVVQFFHTPNSKILIIRCKTEALPSYIIPQVFRKFLFLTFTQ